MELRRYGTATTVFFPLIDKGFTDLEGTPVTIASGDCKISKDGGAFANTSTASFSHVAGGIYSIPLTATEMQAKQIILKIVDQTGTKEWEDQVIIITTCAHASAEIPNLADGSVATAITDIATVDTVVDAIKAKTDNLPSDPADASDIAASHSSLSGKLDAIDDFVDTEVTAIKAKTDLIPASPAATGDIPTAAEIAEEVLTTPVTTLEDTAPKKSLIGVILKLTGRFKALTGQTYKSNDSDVFMTQSPTTDPSADPITELGGGS